MLILAATTDKLQAITSAAVTVDVHCSWIDVTAATGAPTDLDRTNTAITTATTTDIVAAPAAGTTSRVVKHINVRNKHATSSVDVTVQFNQNATLFELHKVTLLAGEVLEYQEGIGWFTLETPVAKLDQNLVVTADVVNATTSFADVTGLTVPVLAGKTYLVEAMLIHVNNATTTGSRFGFNGPAMTYVIASTIDTVTPSVTASAHSAGAVTALETAITAQTTGSIANRSALINGSITPSADGTFAMRCSSEVAVAAGLTVRRGSWLKIREADNA